MPKRYKPWEEWYKLDKRARVLSYWGSPVIKKRREDFHKFLSEVLPENCGSILDFGCGTGEDFTFLNGQCQKYYGCDVTEEMLRVAKTRHPEGTFFIDDLLKTKQKNKKYDVVVCNAVIPHIPRRFTKTCFKTLIGLTDKVLVIRMFGVGTYKNTQAYKINGFHHIAFSKHELVNIVKATKPPEWRWRIQYRPRIQDLDDLAYILLYKVKLNNGSK
jgi:SAM-dependent methyltransferase